MSGKIRNTFGFVLMELLAVVAIVAVLAAILLPALARARESARRASCMNNLMQIGMSLHLYAQENAGSFPWSGGSGNADCLIPLVGDYIPDMNVLVCPSDARGQFERGEDGSIKLTANMQRYDSYGTPINGANQYGLASVRHSYDYFGAYTKAPITLPPATRGIPRWPVMWDITEFVRPQGSDIQAARFQSNGYPSISMNHLPSGGNVLWLDGSVEFMVLSRWAASNLPSRPTGLDFVDPESLVQAEIEKFEASTNSNRATQRKARAVAPRVFGNKSVQSIGK